uniref:DNA-damage-inducible protein J n=1 Tax=Curvibacter symbiont subsp. Hydra magnipapillata TaxID=667019 RepID=C9Y6Q7_CURXX|nr:hypothetical protein Csp_E36340 [Curvibacter putative symbiont of Hydra magnipapillata]
MDAVVKARVDSEDRDAAIAVLESLGLRLSDLIRMTIVQTAKLKTLPFKTQISKSNALAINEVNNGKAIRISRVVDIEIPSKKKERLLKEIA